MVSPPDAPRLAPVSTIQRPSVRTVGRVQGVQDHVRNPTVLVLLGLAVVWALVLTPDLVRMYRQTTSRRPTGLRNVTPPVARRSGSGAVSALGAPTAVSNAAMSRTQAQQRRAMVLFALMVLCAVTLIGGVLKGGSVWAVHLGVDVLLAGYVYMLATRAQNARASKAHRSERAARRGAARPRPSYLQHQAPSPQPAGAVGEVYYLDDVRPGNAVAGYAAQPAAEPAAYYDDSYVDAETYYSDVDGQDAAYAGYEVDDSQSEYYDEWAHQPLRRSVGW